MKKILYTASRLSHIKNFHLPYIQYFKKNGYSVHVVAEGDFDVPYADKIYNIPFHKNLFSIKNIQTTLFLLKIFKKEQYSLIISNSTLAGFLTRIALMLSRYKKSKLIHISHGYLFSESSPFFKKIFYLIAEKICVPVTDLLLTMNQEDYLIATQNKLCQEDIINIPGMGIEISSNCSNINYKKIRDQYNITPEDILLIYPAEFSNRKNQLFLINAFSTIHSKYPKIKLLLTGDGILLPKCRKEVKKKHLENIILMPGHIYPIKDILCVADVAISSSKSEGLPFNIMEAMNTGLPIIASRVKGHVDLVDHGVNGFLFDLDSQQSFLDAMDSVLESVGSNIISNNNSSKIKNYTIDTIFDKIINIYERCLL